MTAPIYITLHDHTGQNLVNTAHIISIDHMAHVCRVVCLGGVKIHPHESFEQIQKLLLDAGVTVKSVR